MGRAYGEEEGELGFVIVEEEGGICVALLACGRKNRSLRCCQSFLPDPAVRLSSPGISWIVSTRTLMKLERTRDSTT